MYGTIRARRVLLVDPDRLAGPLLAAALRGETTIEMADWVEGWPSAMVAAQANRYDLMMVSLELPGGDPIQAAVAMCSELAVAPKLAFSGLNPTSFQRYRVGQVAGATLLNRSEVSFADLIRWIQSEFSPGAESIGEAAIGATRDGGLALSSQFDVVEESPWGTVKPRELRLLEILAQGGSNQSAADELGLSLRSIEKSLHSMRTRLGLRTTSELIAQAAFERLLRPQVASRC